MAFSSGFSRGGLHRPQADINVTPLVDVMLVLLIVFMVTAPMLAQGLKVDLPQAKAAQQFNPKEPIVVSVTADGKVALGQDEMEPSAVVEAILGRAEGDKTRLVQIRADKGASYGAIVTVIDELASNGLVHLALVSDRKAGAPTTAPASDPAMAAAPAAPAAPAPAAPAPAADAAAVATVASARNPASK
jgi:biopolymer transport protein ExbD/biopolymer transport protein TolR